MLPSYMPVRLAEKVTSVCVLVRVCVVCVCVCVCVCTCTCTCACNCVSQYVTQPPPPLPLFPPLPLALPPLISLSPPFHSPLPSPPPTVPFPPLPLRPLSHTRCCSWGRLSSSSRETHRSTNWKVLSYTSYYYCCMISTTLNKGSNLCADDHHSILHL